ncbi:MAG: IPT/TIG domain-containing protein [Legionella sp.]|nr:IPT/TIG domain-containing protein [Legionella sp.]
MQRRLLTAKIIVGIASLFLIGATQANKVLWEIIPLTETTLSVPTNSSATVLYHITNQSKKTLTLQMKPIKGITQITKGTAVCGKTFTLDAKNPSCILSLRIEGDKLRGTHANKPIICQKKPVYSCGQPAKENQLNLQQAPPTEKAILSILEKPAQILMGNPCTSSTHYVSCILSLITNGPTGTFTIFNNSTTVTAKGITSNFTGTALSGRVRETGNSCVPLLAPQKTCVLTYTPGGTVTPQTNFTIKGKNTSAITAAITINSSLGLTSINPTTGAASGGTAVTLTGSGLTGTTAVTFDGVPATNVHVVNATTVTAVTPAHAVGSVTVQITAPTGNSSLANGYTYVTTTVGQPSSGGIVACLGGGTQNLITASSNNSSSIEWGGAGTFTNTPSTADGAANTTTIVAVVGNNGGTPYAAQLCDTYQVDSQGNTPCQTGNACYSDWFLPATAQLTCLYDNQITIGGFNVTNYWSSTEQGPDAAFSIDFTSGSQQAESKNTTNNVRCVRSFTP